MVTSQATLPARGKPVEASQLRLISDFKYPEDFQKACSKEGVEFRILKRVLEGGKETLKEGSSKCLIKIRILKREPSEAEKAQGIAAIELVSANMWIDGKPGCRMDRTLEHYANGKVVGDMMVATPKLDRSDPQVCEMDKVSRYDVEGNLSLNGFWASPEFSFHTHKGGSIKWMGRSLLSILDSYCMDLKMESFRMRTPTAHERDILVKFYMSRNAAVMSADPANRENPFAIRVEFKPDTLRIQPRVYDEGTPWPGTAVQG